MDLAQELFELAEAARHSLAEADAAELVEPLAKIDRVAQDAKLAWSGSNLGYHADVYYQGLQPPPPGVHFSAEWGLEERWPVHSPDHGWQQMGHQLIVTTLLARAQVDDTKPLEDRIERLCASFDRLRERGIGLLTSAARNNDAFIHRQLGRVEGLTDADPSTIAQSLASTGPGWTRDSLAATQGTRVAPHQELLGLVLARQVVENGFVAFEMAVREAAVHLQREQEPGAKGSASGRVFIGHGRSLVWRELKDFIHDRLNLPFEEFNRVSPAGIAHTARLQEMLDGAIFAFLVLTAEDEQADQTMNPRLNVVHEAGLFQGRLGFTKAIILLEEGCEEFSNIHGLGQIRFSVGKIGSCFEEIRLVLEREGFLTS